MNDPIRYIPTASAAVAAELSAALWALERPPQVRQEGEVTTGLFGWVKCLDDSTVLEVDTEYQMTVHPLAELNGIAGVLQPLIDADPPLLPADTNTVLADYINAHRGQVITVYSAFPQFFKDQSLDLAGMIAAGKLNNPDTP